MAEPFKNLLDASRVKLIAADFARAWPAFPTKRFLSEATTGLEPLELKARASHIAKALTNALPTDVTRALEIATASLGPPLPKTEGNGVEQLRHLALAAWLHEHGPRAVEAALEANYQLTQRFSAEFSIRSLLASAPTQTFRALERWASDESPHVRRLVSEGTRPRLPWAERLPAVQRDPTLVAPLLERLKDDPSEYVRRSVANHLNDVAKDHPEHVLAVARRWLRGASKERRRLVEHALRTLLKAGNPKALELVGASAAELEVAGSVHPKRLPIGDAITVEATVHNGGATATHVVVEAIVHFKRPTGSAKKTFRLARFELAAGATKQVSRRFTMAHRSIRQLHPGAHQVDVQANGRLSPAGRFVLVT